MTINADSTKEKFAECEKQMRNFLSSLSNSFISQFHKLMPRYHFFPEFIHSFIHSLSAHSMTDAVGGTRDIVV